MTVYFKNGKFDVRFYFNVIDKDSFWMEYEGPGELGGDVGRENPYYRISGQLLKVIVF